MKTISRTKLLILSVGIFAAAVVNGAIAMQVHAEHERAIAAMPVVHLEPIVIHSR